MIRYIEYRGKSHCLSISYNGVISAHQFDMPAEWIGKYDEYNVKIIQNAISTNVDNFEFYGFPNNHSWDSELIVGAIDDYLQKFGL